jgi:ankyrin repeat protein
MGAIVSLLVKHGAELGARDDGGANPFHYAASEGHIKALAPLIAAAKDQGGGKLASYLAQGDAKRYTPLHWAAQYGGGAPDAARMLLKAGAKVDARAVKCVRALPATAPRRRAPLHHFEHTPESARARAHLC